MTGNVVPVDQAFWLMLTAVDVLDCKALSIDLRHDGLWWDCAIFDDSGTARPRKGLGLHRR